MTHSQDTTQGQAALLRNDNQIDTPVKNSLCCAAAGIMASSSATAETLIPHEKLRGAALADATLNAQERPPAQPVVGYTPPTSLSGNRDGAPRYWPANLTNVHPEEWATISPWHVAEYAGMTEIWLLLKAAQKRIAELEQDKTELVGTAA